MWTPVDTRFDDKKLPVAIAHVDRGEQAIMLRHLLEELGAIVLLHGISTPGDFTKVISQGDDAPPFLIIASHGDENGLVFGEYIPRIDVSMLVEGSMPSSYIAQQVRLPGTFVINVSCYGGQPSMSQAFLSGGARGYIGTDPNPPTSNHALFIASFFLSVIRRKRSAQEAWKLAAGYDEHSRSYLYYDEHGMQRVE